MSHGEGIKSVSIQKGEETAVNQMLLIQGESATISATAETGYSFRKPVWKDISAIAKQVSIANADKNITTVTASLAMKQPGNVTLCAYSDDDQPVINNYKAVRAADGKSVVISANISDTKALAAYGITQSAQAPESSDECWREVTGTSQLVSEEITSKGTYYLWVKDSSDNIVRSASIAIYEIQFSKGTGTGTMDSVLKVQNTDIYLPTINKETFQKEGYLFQQWKGLTGFYKNGGKYSANGDDVLVAQWTNEIFDYSVNYYYMDVNGTYTQEPDSIGFTAIAGDEISSDKEELQVEKAGFALDEARVENLVIDGSGKVLNIYYLRKQFSITYQYTFGDETVSFQKDTYYYGQEVEEASKPSKEGYRFVGWLYGESGSAPTTMPNKDITAAGYFAKELVDYQVNYYVQNLENNSYTLFSQETKKGEQDSDIKVTGENAISIEGFTVAGLTKTYGAVGGISPEEEDMSSVSDGVSGVILSSQKLHINYYYSRNKYNLTLNVWKENREDGSQVYTHNWIIPYGTVLNAATYEEYEKDKWKNESPVSLEGYVVADYIDWSTGSVPSVMPANDVVVAREYVTGVDDEYKIEAYYENADDTYSLASTFTYYAMVGSSVTVGKGTGYTINTDSFASSLVNSFSLYEYVKTEDSVESGIVRSEKDPNGALTLRVYFQRREFSSTVKYNYYNETTNSFQVLAEKTVTQKWGKTYVTNPGEFFYGTGSSEGYSSVDVAHLNTNFCQNGYIVSYRSYSEAGWKVKQITTKEGISEDLSLRMYNTSNGNKNEVNVYYIINVIFILLRFRPIIRS